VNENFDNTTVWPYNDNMVWLSLLHFGYHSTYICKVFCLFPDFMLCCLCFTFQLLQLIMQGHHSLSSHFTSLISAKRFNHAIPFIRALCLSFLLQISATPLLIERPACVSSYFVAYALLRTPLQLLLPSFLHVSSLQSPGFLSLYADDLMLRRFGFPKACIPQRTLIISPA